MKAYEQSDLTVMRSQEMFHSLLAPNTKLNHIRKLLLPNKYIIWDGLFSR